MAGNTSTTCLASGNVYYPSGRASHHEPPAVACTAEAGVATTIFQGLDCFISGGFRSHKTSMKFKFCGDDINERPEVQPDSEIKFLEET